MNRLLLLLFLYFLGLTGSQAQLTSIDSAGWYHKQAENIWSKKISITQFKPYLKRAATLYHQHGYFVREADCYRTLSKIIWVDDHDFQGSKTMLDSAIQLVLSNPESNTAELFMCYGDLTNLYLANRHFDLAITTLEKCIELGKDLAPLSPETSPLHPEGYIGFNQLLCSRKNIAARVTLANIYLKKNQISRAKKILDEVMQTHHCAEDKKWLLSGIYSLYYRHIGEYDKALTETYQVINNYPERSDDSTAHLSMSYTHIAELYKLIGLNHQSIKAFEKVLSYEKKKIRHDTVQISKTHNWLGELYREMGQYQKALSHYEYALELIFKVKGAVNFSTGSVFNNIGETHYALGNYEEALVWHQKALKIRLQIKNHPYRTNSYDNIGMTYLKLGKEALATQYLSKAYQLRSQFPKTPSYASYLSKSFLHLAELAHTQGDFSKALSFYQKATENTPADLQEDGLANYHTFNRIGQLHVEQHNFEEALVAFAKATRLNAPGFDPKDIGFNHYHNAPALLLSLNGQAKALTQRYREKQQRKFLIFAFKHYRSAMQLLVKIRQSYTSQTDKLTVGNYAKEIYRKAMDIGYQLYQQKPDEKLLEELFYISEQSKAGALLDAQKIQFAQAQAVLPDSLIEREKRLLALQSYYQQKVNQTEKQEKSKWSIKLFEVNQERERFIKRLERFFPKYHELKYQEPQISLKGLQSKLTDQEVFLEFFEGRQHIYAFVVQKNGFTVKTLTPIQSTAIQAFRKSILKRNWQQYTQLSYQFYQQLIEPLSIGNSKQLVIIPDGMLWHINFDLLIKQPPVVGDYSNLTYLLHDIAIRYAYSGAYLLNHNEVIHDSNGGLLAFAPSYERLNQDESKLAALGDKFRGQVAPLHHTEMEVEQIGNQIGGDIYVGAEAVERNFKDHINEHSILHLAMHALIDNEEPAKSRLVFSHQDDSLEDNFLHVYELYNMKLPIDMAVLSACNTGFGKLETGEGFMSLGRAFAYAGCPSVVMSHWKVDDQATAQIMELFYQELAKGLPKSTALQIAKINYLKQSSTQMTAPFFWGSFVVMGNNAPIQVERSINWWPWGIGFALLVMISSIVIRAKKTVSSFLFFTS